MDFILSKIPGTLTVVRTTRAAGHTAAQERLGTAGNVNNSRAPKLVETRIKGMLSTVGMSVTAGTPAEWYTGNRSYARNVGKTKSWQGFNSSMDNSNSRTFILNKIPGTLTAVGTTRAAAGPTAAQERIGTAGPKTGENMSKRDIINSRDASNSGDASSMVHWQQKGRQKRWKH